MPSLFFFSCENKLVKSPKTSSVKKYFILKIIKIYILQFTTKINII